MPQSRQISLRKAAYNSARLREGCQLFANKMLEPDVTIGMSLAGALTPAGLGCSSVIPLIKAGFVDWIVATGANLYHDLHFAFNFPVHVGSHLIDDTDLRKNDIVRIYDVLLGYSDCLMTTDEILRNMLVQPEFQKEMGTAELHHLIGRYAAEWERKAGLKNVSVLAAAYRAGVQSGDSIVEIDGKVVQLAEKYFDVHTRKNTHIFTEDAFKYLKTNKNLYDVIYMDAFLKPSETFIPAAVAGPNGYYNA